MCNLYCEQDGTLRREYGETEWFPIGKNVRQGCILPPYLLSMFTEHTINKAGIDSHEGGVKTDGRNNNNLRDTDDTI